MSVGVIGFVTDVVVGVAVVGVRSMAACVGGVRGLKVERERVERL